MYIITYKYEIDTYLYMYNYVKYRCILFIITSVNNYMCCSMCVCMDNTLKQLKVE